MLDQPHNAGLIIGLGCALSSIPFAKLTAKKLAVEVRRVFANEKGVKNNAAKIGETIRAESDRALDIYSDIVETALRGDAGQK